LPLLVQLALLLLLQSSLLALVSWTLCSTSGNRMLFESMHSRCAARSLTDSR